MYNLAYKVKSNRGRITRYDILCKTIDEALEKLNHIKNQDDKESWVVSQCLFELLPLAYDEEEMKKLNELRKRTPSLTSNFM